MLVDWELYNKLQLIYLEDYVNIDLLNYGDDDENGDELEIKLS